ncbi:MAG: cobalamin-dependent protein, partial [Candidatus Saganbacteria bacterium]|nr:cobalamin-dependent protein [Candidatus Saganbacteria bacterium]
MDIDQKDDNNLTDGALQESWHGTSLLVIFDEGNQGAIILYEQLAKNNYPCKLIYYLTDNEVNRKALQDFILISSVIFIGFSFASHSATTAFNIADYIRRKCPQIPIVFGGVHPTLDHVSCLDHSDAVCLGEGDLTILEILERIKTGQNYLISKNLAHRDGGSIIRNPMNPLISNLDILPIRRPYTEDHIFIKNGQICPLNKEIYFE